MENQNRQTPARALRCDERKSRSRYAHRLGSPAHCRDGCTLARSLCRSFAARRRRLTSPAVRLGMFALDGRYR